MAVSYSLVDAEYESEFLRSVNAGGSVLNDQTSVINIRGEYKINNNHSFECGLQLREREGLDSVLQERNKVYLGWKLTI